MSGDASSGTGRAAPLDPVGLSACELAPPQPQQQGAPPPRKARCRYFGQKSGCRSGAACLFRHEAIDTTQQSTATMQQQPARRSQPSRPLERSPGVERDPIDPSGSTTGRPVAPVNTSRITQRPVPQSQLAEPREYQLSQIRRRFAPKEHNKNSSTVLTFRLRPSDPDFPFDMEALHCSLLVPLDYPNGGPPTLKVTNPHMARGYQINVEHGFDQIVATAVSSTLLAHLNSLDKQLESLLSAPKADTIKIVSHKKAESNSHVTTEPEIPPPSLSQIRVQKTANLIIVPTAEQRSRAKEKRDVETRQLEARMGRLPQFSKSPDGLTYTIPMEPRKRNSLPVELQAIKLVKLIVAADYNLSPCRIQLVGVNGASASTMEECFLARVSKFPDMTLLNHMNHLSQNMHLMAKEEVKSPHTFSNTNTALPLTSPEPTVRGPRLDSPRPPLPTSDLPDRSQVVTIPRPPEWNPGTEEDAEISDSSSDEDSEFEGDDDNNTASEHEMSKPEGPSSPERGILVSFPHIELHGIELLEITSLSVTVKCDRCKDTKDIANLQNNNVGNHTRLESCKKCANAFTIGFRAGLMHANSSRAGYLDLDGCMVVDMLPSGFVPTCSECSTAYSRAGVVSVRGETSRAFCHQCHRKMTFRLPEIKFLRVSASIARASRAPTRKKKPENLGIVVGQELPNRGRCSHYKKSYRWFRFSCCQKVYPCDRCHDEAADHALEHANRVICGFCSREQNYRPKDCGICHASLTVRPGKGFWEGGKGTRDKTKMSRKDPRKYKRVTQK